MARITVEDCIDKFPSRFELVLVASNRARKLHSGEEPTVEKDNDKNTVIALREIAQETITSDKLKTDLIEEYQTTTFSEDDDLGELEESVEENENNVEEKEDNSENLLETNNSNENEAQLKAEYNEDEKKLEENNEISSDNNEQNSQEIE